MQPLCIEAFDSASEGASITASATEGFYYPTLGFQASPRRERLDYFQAYNGAVRQPRGENVYLRDARPLRGAFQRAALLHTSGLELPKG